MSGTALIATAIVAFVVLVSLQAVRDWPLANIGGAGDNTGISTARPAARVEGAAGHRAAAASRLGARGGGKPHGKGAPGVDRSGNAALGASPASSGGPLAGSPGSTAGGTAGGGSAPSGASGSGAAGGGDSQSGTGNPGPSTSGSVAGTIGNGVSGVDETTGGALGEAGVTQVTEETVNGVAGPESPVGKTVDKATETAGGLTGG